MAEPEREITWGEVRGWIMGQMRNQRLLMFAEQFLGKIEQAEGAMGALRAQKATLEAEIAALVDTKTQRLAQIDELGAAQRTEIKKAVEVAQQAASQTVMKLAQEVDAARQKKEAEEADLAAALMEVHRSYEETRLNLVAKINDQHQTIFALEQEIAEKHQELDKSVKFLEESRSTWAKQESEAKARVATLEQERAGLLKRLRQLGE